MIQYLYFNVLQTSEAKSFFFTFNFLTKITECRKSMKNHLKRMTITAMLWSSLSVSTNFPISEFSYFVQKKLVKQPQEVKRKKIIIMRSCLEIIFLFQQQLKPLVHGDLKDSSLSKKQERRYKKKPAIKMLLVTSSKQFL